ncbi:unnamed protein product [Chrysoparadoxa australica]
MSKKTLSPEGSHVMTFASEHIVELDTPTEVALEIPASGRAGVSFSGAKVSKVQEGSIAQQSGVQVGWQILKIAGKSIEAGEAILPSLNAARQSKKKYTLVFSLPSLAPCCEEEKEKEKEKDQPVGMAVPPEADELNEAQPEEVCGEEEGCQDKGEVNDGAAQDKGEVNDSAAQEQEEAQARADKLKRLEEEKAAAVKAELLAKANGEVILKYELYDEKFEIADNSMTEAAIDETYCLSFVMPGCKIKLCTVSPQEKLQLEQEGKDVPYIDESPPGVYCGLVADETYFVFPIQKEEQLKLDQQRMAKVAIGMEDTEGVKREGESCSCLEGNPCVDEYLCKDWERRLVVAKQNGWKGF